MISLTVKVPVLALPISSYGIFSILSMVQPIAQSMDCTNLYALPLTYTILCSLCVVQHVSVIKVAMLSLASTIPSLSESHSRRDLMSYFDSCLILLMVTEHMCHAKLLTKGNVVRHLPTILSNKEFIRLQKKLLVQVCCVCMCVCYVCVL